MSRNSYLLELTIAPILSDQMTYSERHAAVKESVQVVIDRMCEHLRSVDPEVEVYHKTDSALPALIVKTTVPVIQALANDQDIAKISRVIR